jgi:hypothetical protein
MVAFHGEVVIPREAVKVMTTRFPKMQKAIRAAIAFGAAPSPKMSLKNSVAMSRGELSCWPFGTAQN